MDGRVFAPFLNERVALIRVLYTLHTFARYNRKELAAIATSFRSFVSGKVFSTAGTKAEFFPLSSSFFLLFLPVELSFREESGSTRLENKQSYNFSPRAFFQTFVRLRVILCNASHGRTSASISTLPSCDTGSHPSIAPEHPQLRGSLLPSFSQVFSFRGGTIKVNDLYASFIRLTLKTSRESTGFLWWNVFVFTRSVILSRKRVYEFYPVYLILGESRRNRKKYWTMKIIEIVCSRLL